MVSSIVLKLVAVVAALSASEAAKLKLADVTSPCSVDDPKLNECVLQAMTTALPIMSKGLRDFSLIPFDPLQVPQVEIDQRGSSAVGLKLTFLDSKHEGVSQLVPTSVRVVPQRMYFAINATLPSYRIHGEYDASGRILLLPISGHGPSDLRMKDLTIQWVFLGKPEMRNNKMYCRLTDSRMKLSIKSGSFRFEGLFNGDKLLGDNMNRVLNENFSDVISELSPSLDATFSELYLRVITPIFANIPYQDIFPGVEPSSVTAGDFNV